jgi:hypothetical protein
VHAHKNSYSTVSSSSTDRRHTDVRILVEDAHKKNPAVVSEGSSSVSLAAIPFSKVSSKASVCVKVVYEFACSLCGTCVLLSHSSVFSIAAVCCSFCDIFSHTVVVRTSLYHPTHKSTDEGQSSRIFVINPQGQSHPKSTRCSLIGPGSFQGVLRRFVGYSDSRRYYPLRGFHFRACALQIRGSQGVAAVLSIEGFSFQGLCFADSWVTGSHGITIH